MTFHILLGNKSRKVKIRTQTQGPVHTGPNTVTMFTIPHSVRDQQTGRLTLLSDVDSFYTLNWGNQMRTPDPKASSDLFHEEFYS